MGDVCECLVCVTCVGDVCECLVCVTCGVSSVWVTCECLVWVTCECLVCV